MYNAQKTIYFFNYFLKAFLLECFVNTLCNFYKISLYYSHKVTEMKKLLFALPILALATLGATGCDSKKKTVNIPRITYGTYMDTEAIEINYTELVEKAVVNEETMLVSVYDGTDGKSSCGCWNSFLPILNEYVQTYHTRIYYISRYQFAEGAENYGLTILKESSNPTLALMQNGRKFSEYIYSKDTKPMFTSLDSLRSAIKHICRDPNLFMVNQAFLDDALFTRPEEKVVVEYVWRTCPDCNDCLPEVILPYSFDNDFSTNIWIIDLDVEGLLRVNGEKDKTNENYVNFLKEHHMSNKEDLVFGYDRGFVPTMQIWEKGVLKDMTVYFNDTLSKDGDNYKVTQTYYTPERVLNLSYTDTVLLGLEVPATDVTLYGEYASWNADAARKQHKPILESFLDMYVK